MGPSFSRRRTKEQQLNLTLKKLLALRRALSYADTKAGLF